MDRAADKISNKLLEQASNKYLNHTSITNSTKGISLPCYLLEIPTYNCSKETWALPATNVW